MAAFLPFLTSLSWGDISVCAGLYALLILLIIIRTQPPKIAQHQKAAVQNAKKEAKEMPKDPTPGDQKKAKKSLIKRKDKDEDKDLEKQFFGGVS